MSPYINIFQRNKLIFDNRKVLDCIETYMAIFYNPFYLNIAYIISLEMIVVKMTSEKRKISMQLYIYTNYKMLKSFILKDEIKLWGALLVSKQTRYIILGNLIKHISYVLIKHRKLVVT